MLADRIDAVIGVDTHLETHTACLLDRLGAEQDTVTVPATPAGHAQLLAWARAGCPEGAIVFAVEGARSHGVGLVRALCAAGQQVVEAPQPRRHGRGAKSDHADAALAARAALTSSAPNEPRADGDREALRLLLIARQHATRERTAAVNLLKSLILTAPDDLRGRFRHLTTHRQLQRCVGLRVPNGGSPSEQVRRAEMRRLGSRALQLDIELAANKQHLTAVIARIAPRLLAQPGVGPVTAAQAIIAWSHPGRFRNEAAFAALAGVCPLEASSGRIVRHRVNRGGDRGLNAGLHTIAITRARNHAPTQAYISRRRAEGKTDREIRRCLKRYIARQLFRLMEATAHHTPAPGNRPTAPTAAAVKRLLLDRGEDWRTIATPGTGANSAPPLDIT
jgi:transposase